MRTPIAPATLIRALAGTALVAAASLTVPVAPALADGGPNNGQPNVVDEPDTSNLNNTWTFAPLGIPVFGVIQAVSDVPQRLLPSP